MPPSPDFPITWAASAKEPPYPIATSMPALPLGACLEQAGAVMTGTDISALAPTLALNWCKRSTPGTNADKLNTDGQPITPSETVAVRSEVDKGREPLTNAVEKFP